MDTPAIAPRWFLIVSLPGIATWGVLVARNSLRVAGLGTPDNSLTPALVPAFEKGDLFITGAFALEQDLIFSTMILAAMTVYIIEQKFGLAAIWAIAAGVLSWLGLMHNYH